MNEQLKLFIITLFILIAGFIVSHFFGPVFFYLFGIGIAAFFIILGFEYFDRVYNVTFLTDIIMLLLLSAIAALAIYFFINFKTDILINMLNPK